MPQIAKNIPNQEILPMFEGRTTEITLPSGRVVKIRETNGADDDILSSINAAADGSNTYNFLASIILHDSEQDGKPTANDLKNWLINDKYGLLFKQRVFVHGYDLKFKATCIECETESEYEEDLKKWDTDLKINDANDKAIARYPLGKTMVEEFITSSGKKFKYALLNGILEKKALELKDATKNSSLVIRNLQVENKGEWALVTHFGGFGSKEMIEIRSHVKINDKQFDPVINFNCSNPMCKKDYSVSLFQIGSFFYPEEMI